MGMEMLIKALLNAVGYTNEDLQKAIAFAKLLYERGEKTIAEVDARSKRIEEMQEKILQLLQNSEVAKSTTSEEPK